MNWKYQKSNFYLIQYAENFSSQYQKFAVTEGAASSAPTKINLHDRRKKQKHSEILFLENPIKLPSPDVGRRVGDEGRWVICSVSKATEMFLGIQDSDFLE
jgi:hypothetical protein